MSYFRKAVKGIEKYRMDAGGYAVACFCLYSYINSPLQERNDNNELTI